MTVQGGRREVLMIVVCIVGEIDIKTVGMPVAGVVVMRRGMMMPDDVFHQTVMMVSPISAGMRVPNAKRKAAAHQQRGEQQS